jgi:hypothetical protein
MKAQPWQERRREYLREKGRLDNLVVMRVADGAQRRPTAEAVRSGKPAPVLSVAPSRVISGEVAVTEQPRGETA